MNTQDEIKQLSEAGVSQVSGKFAKERQRLLEDEKKLVCEKKRLDEEKRRLKEEEKRLDCEKKKLNKEKRRLRKAEKESHKEEKLRRNTDKEAHKFIEKLNEIKEQCPDSVFQATVGHEAEKLSMNLWPKWVRVIGYILFGLSIAAGFVEMSRFRVFDYLPQKDPSILSLILNCSLDIFILYILSFLNSRFFNVLIMLPLQILARNQYKERLKKWCKQYPNDERGDYLSLYNDGSVKLIWVNFFKPKWGSEDLCWMPWV